MTYIYDTVIEKGQKTLRRYGRNFKLESRSRMGENLFYQFATGPNDKLLVVPRFAEHYIDIENKVKKFDRDKTLDYYIKKIQKCVSADLHFDRYPNSDSETGMSDMIFANCGDISVTFEFFNNTLHFSDEFEIIDGNLFGNGIVVSMHVNSEE